MIIKNNNMVDSYQKTSINKTDNSNTAIAKNNTAVNNNAKADLTPKADTVSLSEEAKLRTLAHTEATNTPDARADKVARLKEEVRTGTYTPNSLRTAKAMVSDMFSDKALYQ